MTRPIYAPVVWLFINVPVISAETLADIWSGDNAIMCLFYSNAISLYVSNNEQDGGHANRCLHWLWKAKNNKSRPSYTGDSNEARERILKV